MNRLDVYTAVHKMQRARLCRLIVDAGIADPDDADGRARLAAAVEATIAELRAHAHHEDRFIHPLLHEKAPRIAAKLDAEHAGLEAQLDHLASTAAGYAESAEFVDDPNALYRALADFAATYFGHIAVEETEARPALWDTCSDDELAGIMISFRASHSPIENLAGLLAQLPTLNPPEIARMVSVAIDSHLQAEIGQLLATLLQPGQLGGLAKAGASC